MRITVVHAHPDPSSFSTALFHTVVDALRAHEIDAFDLYADGFMPAMSATERHGYHGESPMVDPLVQRYAQAVNLADALVFVYPTWWSGLPAMVKGWLEKVMVPGVAFGFDAAGKVEPRLQHVRRIAGVSTYGSSRWRVLLATDGGRRTLLRALRVSTGFSTRTTWLGLYGMDTITAGERQRFLVSVHEEFASW
jgi:putative NADPH-quinone reductase